MASRNVEAVRRATDAFRRRDMEAMLREVDPEVEFSDPERTGPGPYHGHDAYIVWLEEWLESWESYDIEVEALVEVPDRVVALVHHQGRARGSGLEIDHRGANLYGLREGKITSYRPFTHPAEALEAAGLQDGSMWRNAIATLVTGYQHFNRGDVGALLALVGADVEFVPILQSPDMPPFRMGDGLEPFMANLHDTWDQFTFEPVAFTPAGVRLLVEVEANAKAKASRIELQEHWAHLYTLRDGEPSRLQAFTNMAEAMDALAYPERR